MSKNKYKHFLDSCERQISAKGRLHSKDLILGATTIRGRKLRHGIPHTQAVRFALKSDGRFVETDGLWELKQ